MTFTYDYCMDSKLVTQQQFSEVMGANPSNHQTARPDLLRRLRNLVRRGALFSPTETANITALGAVYAWYSGNSGGVTQPVGKLKPNPWGLYDIVGNLFEWENDWEART